MPVTNLPSCSNANDPSLTSSTTFDIGPALTLTDHSVPTGSESATPFNSNSEQKLNGEPASSAKSSRVGSL